MNLKSARGRPPAGTEVDTRPSRPAATDLCIVLPSRRLSPDPLPECALNVQSLLAKSMTSGTLLLVLLFSACSENLLLSYGDDTNFLLLITRTPKKPLPMFVPAPKPYARGASNWLSRRRVSARSATVRRTISAWTRPASPGTRIEGGFALQPCLRATMTVPGVRTCPAKRSGGIARAPLISSFFRPPSCSLSIMSKRSRQRKPCFSR